MFKRKANRPMLTCSSTADLRKKAGITAECFTGSDYMSVHWGFSMIVSDKLTVMRSQRKKFRLFQASVIKFNGRWTAPYQA